MADDNKTPHRKSTSELLFALRENDVLMGRGKNSNNRPGNVRFRELATEWSVSYHSAETKVQKTNVAQSFIQEMQDSGVRFLTPVSVSRNGSMEMAYEVVSNTNVLIKVRQLLRDRYVVMKRKEMAFSQGVVPINNNDPSIAQLPLPMLSSADDTIRQQLLLYQTILMGGPPPLPPTNALPVAMLGATANLPQQPELSLQLAIAEQAKQIRRYQDMQTASMLLQQNEHIQTVRGLQADFELPKASSGTVRQPTTSNPLSSGSSVQEQQIPIHVSESPSEKLDPSAELPVMEEKKPAADDTDDDSLSEDGDTDGDDDDVSSA